MCHANIESSLTSNKLVWASVRGFALYLQSAEWSDPKPGRQLSLCLIQAVTSPTKTNEAPWVPKWYVGLKPKFALGCTPWYMKLKVKGREEGTKQAEHLQGSYCKLIGGAFSYWNVKVQLLCSSRHVTNIRYHVQHKTKVLHLYTTLLTTAFLGTCNSVPFLTPRTIFLLQPQQYLSSFCVAVNALGPFKESVE